MNRAPAQTTAADRVDAIDALRGIAALAVVLYHARRLLWSGTREVLREYGFEPKIEAWIGYISFPLSFGWLGVTLFFVLSGYCVHRRGARLLACNPTAALNIGEFIRRRFFRIYPTYAAGLLLTGLVDWTIFRSAGFYDAGMDDHRWTTLVSSLLALQGFTSPTYGSNGVFWTLALEIHLYMAYPILYWLSKHYGPVHVLAFTFVVSSIFVVVDIVLGIQASLPHHFLRGPIFLPYWFGWSIGFYLAEVEARRAALPSKERMLFLATVGGVGGISLFAVNCAEASELCWSVTSGALIWWSLTTQGGRSMQWLFGRAFVWLGLFSYSLYATHCPVLLLVKSVIQPTGQKSLSLAPALFASCCSIAVAWLFFQTVERWSLRATPVSIGLKNNAKAVKLEVEKGK